MPLLTQDSKIGSLLEDRPWSFIAVCLFLWWLTHQLMLNAVSEEGKRLSEPPTAPTRVPLLGHLYGFVTKKLMYTVSLKSKSSAGIHTIALPFCRRMYVATGHQIAQEIQRNPKSASFSAIASQVCARIGGVSAENEKLVTLNASSGARGQKSYFAEMKQCLRDSVASGAPLNMILKPLNDELQGLIHSTQAHPGPSLPLFAYLKKHVTLITTNVIYGPHNPFKDPKVADAFWTFDLAALQMISLPSRLLPYLARGGYESREIFVSAFKFYVQNGRYKSASAVVKTRHDLMESYNVNIEDRARSELITCFALLENTIPSMFWTVYNTISRPKLLSEARAAAQKYLQPNIAGTEIDLNAIRGDPLLFAIMSETVRCISNSHEARIIQQEDFELSCGYRLRQDSMVIIPTRCIHMDHSVFGPAPTSTFDHTRFFRDKMGPDKGYIAPPEYLGFGVGETLCPGRHFATAEVIGILTTLIVHFDFEEVNEGGKRSRAPAMVLGRFSLGFALADREVNLNVKRRMIS